jgi:hypothetical protein
MRSDATFGICGRTEACKQARAELRRERHDAEQARTYNLVKFGITPQQYDAMLAAQGGTCAICPGSGTGKALAVDHDHACCPGRKSCGKCVRGLLCENCNNGLGRFRDSPELLAAAVAYLTKGCN